MSSQQKKIAAIGLGALVLYYLYQHFAGGSSSPAAPVTTDPGTSSDYASLAGQEQGDFASLQGQESADVTGLQGQLSSLAGQVAGFAGFTPPDLTGLASTADVAALATGEQKLTTQLATNQKALSALTKRVTKLTPRKPSKTKQGQAKGHVNHAHSDHPAGGKQGNAHVAPSDHGPKTSPVGHAHAPAVTGKGLPHTIARRPTTAPAPAKPKPKPKPKSPTRRK